MKDYIKKIIASNKFVVSKDKKDIPAAVLSKIKTINPSFRLANPDEPFQATDHIMMGDTTPSRQLIMIGQYKNYVIITYKRGGIALTRHICFFELKDDTVIQYWTGMNIDKNELNTLELIYEALSSKNTIKTEEF